MPPRRLVLGLVVLVAAVGAPSVVRPVPLAAPAPLSPSDLEELVAEASQRVVAIGCGGASNNGAAVVLDDGTVVTAAHVVGGAQLLNVSPRFGATALPSARVSPIGDLAVLERVNASRAFLPLAEEDPAPGTPVLAAGFPGGALQLDLRASYTVAIVDGVGLGHRGPVLRIDGELEQGFSGGPVVDLQGRMVGMLFAVELGRGTTLALPASEVRRLLTDPEAFGPAPDCRNGG